MEYQQCNIECVTIHMNRRRNNDEKKEPHTHTSHTQSFKRYLAMCSLLWIWTIDLFIFDVCDGDDGNDGEMTQPVTTDRTE